MDKLKWFRNGNLAVIVLGVLGAALVTAAEELTRRLLKNNKKRRRRKKKGDARPKRRTVK